MNPNLPVFHRGYSSSVKKCEDIQNKIDQILHELHKRNIPVTMCDNVEVYMRKISLI